MKDEKARTSAKVYAKGSTNQSRVSLPPSAFRLPPSAFILHPSSFSTMTYCLSLLCREGIVFISDSRTSAGVDNITVQPKMRVYAEKGDRVICLMTSGNLSIT